MRILRRFFLILIILLILGWVGAWFAGRWIIQTRIAPELVALQGGGLAYSADGYGVGGFPFSYSLRPQNAEIRDGDGAIVQASDQAAIHLSLPGTLRGYLRGGAIGPRLSLAGTHELADGWQLDIGRGSITPALHQITALSRDADWAFAGVDMDFRDVRLIHGGTVWGQIGHLNLVLSPLRNGRGYAFTLNVQDVALPENTLQTVPSVFDGLRVSGEIRPEINSGIVAFLADLQAQRRAAIARYPALLGQILASRPGITLDTGTVKWGTAQMDFSGHILLIPIISDAAFEVTVDMAVSGQGIHTFFQTLARDPGLRAAPELIPLIPWLGVVPTVLSAVGLDLQGGPPNTIVGPVLGFDGRNFQQKWTEIEVNGQSLGGLL